MLNSIKRLSLPIDPFIRSILPYLLIIFLIWISRFLLSSSFGLYEDDWPFIGNAVNNTFDQNINMVNKAFFTFWQGRPLHMTFLTFIPSLASKVGGVNALYFIGFLILSSNACLFYSLLKKISVQPYIPIIATLFFCLYPADTTFHYLLHLFGLQTSLLFLLLAFYFYVIFEEKSKYQRIFSYTIAILSLLTYESPFLTFFTAPFLLKNRTKQKIISHFLIVTFILIFYFIIRKITGETRVAELKTGSIIQTLIYQIFVGPIISLGTYFFRPLEIVTQFKIENLLILLIALPILYIVINYFINNEKAIPRDNSEKYLKLPDLLVLGIVMTILAYPSALTVSANIIDGRASRVHFAAILGTTIVLSCLWNFLIIKNKSQKMLKKLTIFFLALHLSFLFIFCINVQNFYKLSWQYQQAFWSDVMALSPDLEKETVILVQAANLAWGKQINPFDWSVPSVLGSIYNFPKDWKFPPRLYILDSNVNNIDGWKSMIDKNNKFLMSNKNGSLRYYYEWEPERKVNSKDIILLVEENNQLVRKPFLKLSNGNLVLLKQNDNKMPLQKYKKSVLFNRLIDDIVRTKSDNHPAIYFESQH
jgi:hypothetical protein